MRRSCPVASRTAAEMRPRKWPSIHSRVKSFGTERVNVSSLSSAPPASANHVLYVVVLRAPLSRPATSAQRLSAVSSSCPSTTPVPSQSKLGERRDYQGGSQQPTPLICRAFRASTRLSTGVDTVLGRGSSAAYRLRRPVD